MSSRHGVLRVSQRWQRWPVDGASGARPVHGGSDLRVGGGPIQPWLRVNGTSDPTCRRVNGASDPSRVQTSCSKDRNVRHCLKARSGCAMAGRLCCVDSGRQDSGRRCSGNLTARTYDVVPDSERLLDLQPACTSVLKLAHMSGVGPHSVPILVFNG